jgi:hypothetical protein
MVGFDAIFNNFDTSGTKYPVVELEGCNAPTILEGMKESIDYLLNADFVKASYDE